MRAGRDSDGAAYSHRDDPAVPSFDDSAPVVVMDGGCALCTGAARMISRWDRSGAFRICPSDSPLGRALLAHHGFDPEDPESWLYLADGAAHSSLDGVIRAGERMGGVARIVSVFRLAPRPARDWIYRRIARNRYRLFGRTDMCAVPDPALRARLIGWAAE